MLDNRLIIQLQSCDSADDINAVLQEQAQAFHKFRGDDGKLIRWLKRTVHVLYTLSTSSALGAAVGLVRWKLLTLPYAGPFSDVFLYSHFHLQMRSSQESVSFSLYVPSRRFSRSVPYDVHCAQAIKDVSASYDALVDLFESTENFLRRLDIYTKIPPTTAMTEIIVKILVELLSILALATQQVKQGRLSASFSSLIIVPRSM